MTTPVLNVDDPALKNVPATIKKLVSAHATNGQRLGLRLTSAPGTSAASAAAVLRYVLEEEGRAERWAHLTLGPAYVQALLVPARLPPQDAADLARYSAPVVPPGHPRVRWPLASLEMTADMYVPACMLPLPWAALRVLRMDTPNGAPDNMSIVLQLRAIEELEITGPLRGDEGARRDRADVEEAMAVHGVCVELPHLRKVTLNRRGAAALCVFFPRRVRCPRLRHLVFNGIPQGDMQRMKEAYRGASCVTHTVREPYNTYRLS